MSHVAADGNLVLELLTGTPVSSWRRQEAVWYPMHMRIVASVNHTRKVKYQTSHLRHFFGGLVVAVEGAVASQSWLPAGFQAALALVCEPQAEWILSRILQLCDTQRHGTGPDKGLGSLSIPRPLCMASGPEFTKTPNSQKNWGLCFLSGFHKHIRDRFGLPFLTTRGINRYKMYPAPL